MSARELPVFHIDAFTRRRFCGNPAVVVLDADCLTAAEMRMLANELHHGDTAFVLRPDAADHDLKLRFFTPARELPFAGHATVAAHFALGLDAGTRNTPRTARVRQHTGAGIIDVEVRGQGDERSIAITLAPPTLGKVLDEREKSQVLDALGLGSTELDPSCPLQVVLKGSTRLMVGLKSARQLGGLRPDLGTLRRLSAHVGADGFFVFARAGVEDGYLTEARMFCPAIGVDEDPVSGNAHGMLGVYLVAHDLIAPGDGRTSFAGSQGRALGRPGRVQVELEVSGRSVSRVTIAGQAVLVYRTTVEI
jgi:PhzF family phenazine biosynthesis protein